MKKILILLFLILNLNFAYSQNLPHFQIANIPQSCFINSIFIYEKVNKQLKEYNIWSNILAIAFLEKENGRIYQTAHAVTIVEWQGKLYLYDVNKGSLPIRVNSSGLINHLKQDHRSLAEMIYPDKKVIDSAYLKNN